MLPTRSSSSASVAGLLVANAVPLVGVLAFGWTLHSVLVVYWLESAVVGAAFVSKVRRAEGEDDPAALPDVSFNGRSVTSFVDESNERVANFLAVHYGGFWLAHGFFVLVAFPTMLPRLEPASLSVVLPGVVCLAAYHAVSYAFNFVARREFERLGPVTLMVEPYRRVFVLHLAIVLGAFPVGAAGEPLGALVVLVLAKTAFDLRGHWSEHERAQRRAPTGAHAE